MLFLQRIEEIALKHDQTLGVIVEMKLERRASRNFEIAQPKTKFWNFKWTKIDLWANLIVKKKMFWSDS